MYVGYSMHLLIEYHNHKNWCVTVLNVMKAVRIETFCPTCSVSLPGDSVNGFDLEERLLNISWMTVEVAEWLPNCCHVEMWFM